MSQEIDYSESYPKTVYEVDSNIMDLLLEKDEELFHEMESSDLNIFEVETPFILPDNYFDLGDDNNTVVEVNVHETKKVTFPGGNMYTVYERTDLGATSLILYGNVGEGFIIFILK